GKREHHVKLTGVSWAGQVPCCPVQRPAKNQGVVRTDVLGEGRAQPGDRAGRCRGVNSQSHRARAGGTRNRVGTPGELGEERWSRESAELGGIENEILAD